MLNQINSKLDMTLDRKRLQEKLDELVDSDRIKAEDSFIGGKVYQEK
jgi:hypothetical protein